MNIFQFGYKPILFGKSKACYIVYNELILTILNISGMNRKCFGHDIFAQILQGQLRENKEVLLTSVDLVCVKEHASEGRY